MPAGYLLDRVESGDGAGQVVGMYYRKSDTLRAGVIWHDGAPSVVGLAFGQNTDLLGINRAGVAVGDYADPHVFGTPDTHHPIEYVHGFFRRLPMPSGYTSGSAARINNRGDILGGVSETPSGGDSATVVWPADKPGTVEVLPAPDIGYAFIDGIDDQGDVIGTFPADDDASYVWPWRQNAIRLQQPDGHVVEPSVVRAGRIYGSSSDVDDAYIWNLDGTVARTLPGVHYVEQVNDSGNVAGHAANGSPVFVPADGGPVQQIDTNTADSESFADLTGDNTVYGTRDIQSPSSHDFMTWRCS